MAARRMPAVPKCCPGKGRSMSARAATPVQGIERKIHLVRGHKVLFDADLATVYGVETCALNQAMKRNPERFAPDFMFRLSTKELENWRSRSVMSNPRAKMSLRRAPLAFTGRGALMAATVLNSPRAVRTSLYVVRVVVRVRLGLLIRAKFVNRASRSAVRQRPRALCGTPRAPLSRPRHHTRSSSSSCDRTSGSRIHRRPARARPRGCRTPSRFNGRCRGTAARAPRGNRSSRGCAARRACAGP